MASADLLEIDVGHGTYGYDGQVHADVSVENTGSAPHTFFVGYAVYGPDGDWYDNDETTGTTITLDPGERDRVTVGWDVESTAPEGSYDVRVSVWEESDPNNLQTRLADRREYDSFYVQEQTVSAAINSIAVDNGTYSTDGHVETGVRVENTGTDSHTFYVGYTIHGPDGGTYENDGSTGQAVSLAAGETRDVVVEWDVASDATEGSYDVQVAIWKQSDPNNLVDRLDEVWAYDSFYVQQTSVEAAIIDFDPARGEYLPGDIATSSVTVENTGNVEHTYYVGYTVFGPNGGEYDNDDTTGTKRTIAAGDSRRVDLDWQVPNQAPNGTYDVLVAVWKESDPDALVTRLDEVRASDTFSVDSDGPDVSASIVEFDVTSGEFTSGGTVSGRAIVENTGGADHTFFVGFGARDPDGREYDNDGTTGKPVTVAGGDRRTVDLEWDIPSNAPGGAYDLGTAVWKESDRSKLETRLDDQWIRDAITVTTVTPSAEIESIGPASGQFAEGQVVTTSIEVRNTGEAEHTFFVGYSVRGPDGEAYDNGDTTGRPVTIAAGATVQVELEWQVTRAAPSGKYDIEVVVWAEADRSELETSLAKTVEREAFEVVETFAAATLEDLDVGSGPFAGGEPVPFEAQVRNEGETEHTFLIVFEPVSPEGTVPTEDPIGQQLALAPDESGNVSVEWPLPADITSTEYDLRVRVYSERDAENLETVLDERTVEDAVVVANPDVSVVDITTTPVDGEVTSFDTTAVATAMLENTGTELTTVVVEHRIEAPDGSLVVSETGELELQPGGSRRASIRWEPSQDQDLVRGRYDYKVTLRSAAEEQVTRTLEDAFEVLIAGLGRTNFTVNLREATGEAVERATVDLSPVEGGERFSQRLRDGDVQFDRIPSGLYELTVDHGDALLEESFDVWVSSSFETTYLTVSVAEAITGSVVDDTGHQPIPDATVRLEGIDETTTGPLGTYSFDQRVPDGTYDMTVEGPDGSTTRQSVTVDESRHVGLGLDRPLVDPTARNRTPNSDLITEENQLVTVFARYLQNTETEDVVINGYTDLIHGVVKGIVAAITDIFESLKETAKAILGLNLEQVLQSFARFIAALWETRGGILYEIAKAILASAVDGVEALHEQQREDNPYEIPNPRAYVFTDGWYLGYIGFNLLLGWAAKVVTLGARGVLTASDAVTDALDTMTDVIRRFDRGGGTTDTPGEVSKLPLLRSQAAANAPDGLPVGGAVFGGAAVTRYVQAAPHSDVLWKIFDSLYRTNHRYLGRMDPDNPTGTFEDPLQGLRKANPKSGDKDNLAGRLAERVISARFLEGQGEFPKVDKILTDFEPRKLGKDETALLLNWERQTGSYSAEFDFLEIEMRRMADGEDPKPVVVRNWESTTSNRDLDTEQAKKDRNIQKVADRTEAKDMATPSDAGLSGEAFVRDGLPEVELVPWNEKLGFSNNELNELAEFVLENDDDSVDLSDVDFLFKPRTNDD